MKVVVHKRGVDLLERQAGMVRTLHRVATTVANEAKRISPSGRYNDEIEVDDGTDEIGRVVSRVNAHHWTSWFIEAGTVNQAPSAPLRKAMESGAARRVL